MAGIMGGLVNNLAAGVTTGVIDQLTKEQEEESWMNRHGWFGSLADGQWKENEYMAANKERIPMILEYLTGPLEADADGKYTEEQFKKSGERGGNRCAITMYINPSRLQFNNNKLVQKSITRGGIFYHHWGDDHTIMSLSGDLGLSSMSGVKRLDEVYRMSGNLLAYGENSAAPTYWDSNTDLMNALANGDYAGALQMAVANKMSMSDFMQVARQHTVGAAIDGVTGRKNNGLQSSKTAQACQGAAAGAVQKVTDPQKGILGGGMSILPNASNNAYTGIADGILGGAVQAMGNSVGTKIGKSLTKTTGCLDYLDENVVSFQDSYGGFSDIMDELEDPWRPRLIWIYFEDHVYIGHFQSFNYTRDAASVNIHYEMSFVVQREVIITSYKSKQPGFVPG